MDAGIVIIGKGEMALALLQGFGRTKRDVHYFIDKRGIIMNYSEFSRYGVKHYFYSIEQLILELSKLQCEYYSKLSVFIASSPLLTEIRLNSREVFEKFNVFPNPLKWVDLFSTKDRMYAYAAANGINISRYKLLTEYKHGDLNFPLILKRNVELDLSFKAKVVYNEDEFDDFIKERQDEYSFIIVQEFISDENLRDISFRAFFSHGQMTGGFAVEEKRNYPIGVSTYIEEIGHCDSAVLQETTTKLFAQTEYTGFVEVGYKYSSETRIPYILDVNPRTPHTHDVFNRKFTNITDFYSTIDTCPVKLKPKSELISWINPIRDMKIHYKRIGFTTFVKQLTRSYWGGGIYDWTDFFMFIKYYSLLSVWYTKSFFTHK